MPRVSLKETKSSAFIAYDGSAGETWSFPDGNLWFVSYTWHSHITGFKACLLSSTSREVRLLAFAGTDSLVDVAVDINQATGGIPPQYHQALMVVAQVRTMSGPSLHLCGHSLGGGLAAYCSVETRLPASTINPAPLTTAAGLSGWFGSNSQITNYIAGGSEFVSSSPGRNPGEDVAVSANGNFFTRHTIANTAPSIPLPQRV